MDRELPNSRESERAILGAILLDNSLAFEAESLLLPEQFYFPSNRKIFEAMLGMAKEGIEINPIGLHEASGEHVPALLNLTFGLPRISTVAHLAKVVREKAMLRQLIKLAAKIDAAAQEQDEEVETILSNAENELLTLGIQSQLSAASTVRSYNQVSNSVIEMFEAWADEKIVAIPTQIPELDHRLAYGGFSAQDFIVIAARTSFGKTALALQIAINVARTKVPVLIFSLEMSAEKLFIRNLSSVTGVPHHSIAPWTFAHDSKLSSEILQGIPKLRDLPLQVEDQTYSLNRLLAVAREWRRKTKDKGLIVADYIQLVKNNLDKRSREQEVAGISMELKRLAKELNVPVIGISQFSRDQAKQNRRPELSDLRESGQLEQDVDVALFPYSQDGNIKDEPVRAMKLYCPKQRSGKAGWEIDIDFDGEHQWFSTERMYRGVA